MSTRKSCVNVRPLGCCLCHFVLSQLLFSVTQWETAKGLSVLCNCHCCHLVGFLQSSAADLSMQAVLCTQEEVVDCILYMCVWCMYSLCESGCMYLWMCMHVHVCACVCVGQDNLSVSVFPLCLRQSLVFCHAAYSRLAGPWAFS